MGSMLLISAVQADYAAKLSVRKPDGGDKRQIRTERMKPIDKDRQISRGESENSALAIRFTSNAPIREYSAGFGEVNEQISAANIVRNATGAMEDIVDEITSLVTSPEVPIDEGHRSLADEFNHIAALLPEELVREANRRVASSGLPEAVITLELQDGEPREFISHQLERARKVLDEMDQVIQEEIQGYSDRVTKLTESKFHYYESSERFPDETAAFQAAQGLVGLIQESGVSALRAQANQLPEMALQLLG